ncbi:hypothetical protein [Accumulibacter sp.]|uniref:hypothetical protein n=1 Tax=Accumulibacter sp. TaxID=2053492 RepID=UPI0026195A06|nr:hypothetical protein [Accumulibacter sp.]
MGDQSFVSLEKTFALTVPDNWQVGAPTPDKVLTFQGRKGELLFVRYFAGVTETEDVYYPMLNLLKVAMPDAQPAARETESNRDGIRRRFGIYTGHLSSQNIGASGMCAVVMLNEGGLGLVSYATGVSPEYMRERFAEFERIFFSVRTPQAAESGTLTMPSASSMAAPGAVRTTAAPTFDLGAAWAPIPGQQTSTRPVAGVYSAASLGGSSLIVLSSDGLALDHAQMREIADKTVKGSLQQARSISSEPGLKTTAGKPIEFNIYEGFVIVGESVPMRAISALAEGGSGFIALISIVPPNGLAATREEIARMAASIR